MHNSKLFGLLRGLQDGELHWFQKFLVSPFYNTNKEYLALFNYIKKYYPDLDTPKLQKAVVCRKLYPTDKTNVQKLRKAMHGLANLVEEFILTMHLKKEPFKKKKLLVTALGERNVYDQFQKGIKEMISDLERLPHRDAQIYQEIHELNLAYYGHVETSKKKENVPILKSATEHLDYYFLLQRQRLEFTIKWHEKLIGGLHSIKSLSEAKTHLQQEPIFKIYALVIKTFSPPVQEGIYEEIEVLFKAEIQRLGRKDKLEIIRILLNHLSGQINKGKEGYATKMLSLYKFALAQDLVVEKGIIGESIFSNIATVGIIAKEFQWVKGFIDDYHKSLPKAVRESVVCLSLGMLNFHEKRYTETIDLILNQDFFNPLHILNAKTILLRTYFELFLLDDNYYDLVVSQTQAFEKFIRRDHFISTTKRKMFLNFILFTRKLTNAVLQKSIDTNLFDTIQKTEPIVLKSWLLDKLSTLEKKRGEKGEER